MNEWTPAPEQRQEALERFSEAVAKLIALFGVREAMAVIGAAISDATAKPSTAASVPAPAEPEPPPEPERGDKGRLH